MQSSDQEALKKLFAENGKSEEKVITQFDWSVSLLILNFGSVLF